MSDKVSLQKLVRNIARRSGMIGLSTLAFKNKAELALVQKFGQTRAKKIAGGLRSGTAELSKKEAVEAIKALKKGKVLKGTIEDVRGEVERFVRDEARPRAEEPKKEAIKRSEIRRRLRQRADVTIKERREEREKTKGKDSSNSKKRSSSQPPTYVTGESVTKIRSSPPIITQSTPQQPTTTKESSLEEVVTQPTEEVQSLREEAESHDLPID